MFVRILCIKEIQVEIYQEVISIEEAEEIGNDVNYDNEQVVLVDHIIDVEEISEAEYLDCTQD